MVRLLSVALLLAGCQNNGFDPATYVNGLRLLTVIAEPPELKAGETTTMRAVGFDTQGRAITYRFRACVAPRAAGGPAIAEACLDEGAHLLPIGDGDSVSFTMPAVDFQTLGLPDATGGVYLPIRVDIAAGDASDVAFYRLRYSLGLQAPNHNPGIAEIAGIPVSDVKAALDKQPPPRVFDEGTPIEVGPEEGVRLQASFTDGSVESYLVLDGNPAEGKTRMVSETPRVLWFASAGTFTQSATGQEKPDTILRLDKFVPGAGSRIDLYLVVTDERGGQAFAHRELLRR